MKLIDCAGEYADTSGKINTVESRRSLMKVIRHFNTWAGGDVIVADVTEATLTAYCMSPLADGRRPAPNTIKKRRAHLCSLFSWAAWKGYVETDPAAQLHWTVTTGSGQVRSHTWLDETTAARIINDRPDTAAGQRDQLVVLLGMLAGMRAGVEIASLRWSSISDDLSTITVVGKGRKLAAIGVAPQLRAALAEWRELAPPGADVVIPRCDRHGFDPSTGRFDWRINWSQPLGYEGILQAVKRVGDRHGVRLRPHDLRRSFAAILESQGVSIADISLAMRHSNVATTSRYLDRNPAKAAKVTAGFTIGGK